MTAVLGSASLISVREGESRRMKTRDLLGLAVALRLPNRHEGSPQPQMGPDGNENTRRARAWPLICAGR
jgi:hypothetical protein